MNKDRPVEDNAGTNLDCPEAEDAACAAGSIPALRAASVDPVRALRSE